MEKISRTVSSDSLDLEEMLKEFIQSPVHPSLDECLSSSFADKILNFDDEDKLIREASHSPRILSSTNNVVCSSNVPVIETFPEPDNTTTELPYNDFLTTELISALLNSQPPHELESDSFPSLQAISMAPIHPLDQLNQMTSNPPLTSYPSNSVVSQLSLNPLGLPGYIGMEPSTVQHCSFLNANGIIGGELYAKGMGRPTCVADDEMGKYASLSMPVRSLEAAKAFGLGEIYKYDANAKPGLYSPRNLHVLGDNQHVRPMCSTNTAPLQVPFNIPTMDDSNYKGCRVSAEERKKKLDRYRRKKRERNFSKQIKYACRKTLADSRPRVRGRFAKNEEHSEGVPTPSSANDEEMALRNDEDKLLNSSDTLAHIRVDSFDFDFLDESWL